MAKLSVIVPFYDETAYLRSALNSIRAQRIDGVQIVVVNDNPDRFSADDLATLTAGTGAEVICHDRNRGLSAARNTGMRAARGRYVGFLDADDYYALGGLAQQLSTAWDTEACITHAQARFTEIGSAIPHVLPRDDTFFGTARTAQGLLRAEEAQFITSSWSSLYARDFLIDNDLWFDPEQTKFEDRLFVLQSICRARKLAFTGEPARIWRGRAGSISVSGTTPDTHRLQVQLLEKCMGVIRAEVAADHLPPRFEKRELFNTVSRLIWDMDVVAAIATGDDPLYADLAPRISALLGDDSFGHAIFDDPVLAPISRVGMTTRKGRITRTDFFAVHKALRGGDFAQAHDILQASRPRPAAPPRVNRRQARRLVLHLGLHKTGTTHIQHHLLRHGARLAAQGVLVPATGFDEPGQHPRPGATPGHQGLAAALRRNQTGLFDQLREEIHRNRADTVVLSCENLAFPALDNRDELVARLAAQLGRFDRVDLLALARRPDSYAEAFYRERVCGGMRRTPGGIGAFLVDNAAALTDWDQLFRPFEEAFATRVTLADFDALRGDALWPGFTELAGLPSDLPGLDAPRYPTPDTETVLLVELMNALVPDQSRRRELLQAWFTLNPDPAATDQSLLPPAARAALLDQWQDRSAAFAAERGYAPDLSAARAALAQEHWQPPGPVAPDKLRDLIDAAAQAAPTAPRLPQHPGPARTPGEMSLTIRLRPWAAGLVRRTRGLARR
ncbi:glycosyltransferase [Seohaeicola saemankumensis]|nr:glycosyltransferase family 2 protein [Seohaeicola saemankumensis]MCA0869713.1 glycosyltransferase [Seohaeicola saemankumensis]